MYRIWLSVLGTGYSPLIPGTCGSAVVALIFLITALLSPNPLLLAGLMLLLALHGCLVTLAYGDRFIKKYGSDPSVIVSDEQCGQALTYLWLWPLAQWQTKEILIFTLAGFVLFRVFDIIKPPPVRQMEKFPGSLGVLLDDVLAGLYAQLTLQLIWRLGWLDIILN